MWVSLAIVEAEASLKLTYGHGLEKKVQDAKGWTNSP